MALYSVGQSGNLQGRPKGSVLSTNGLVDRILKGHFKRKAFEKRYNLCTPEKQMDIDLRLYELTIRAASEITEQEITRLHSMLTQAQNNRHAI
jgi:hypothetical protein